MHGAGQGEKSLFAGADFHPFLSARSGNRSDAAVAPPFSIPKEEAL